MNKIIVNLVVISLCLILSGCISGRFTSTQVDAGPPCFTQPVKFKISKAVFTLTDSGNETYIANKQIDAAISEYLSPEILMRCAEKRYPQIFSNTDTALLINLSGRIKFATTMRSAVVLEVCTLAIIGGIFPLPVENTLTFDLEVRLDGSQTGNIMKRNESFTAIQNVWVSIFTPLALIAVPGKSDIAKKSTTVFNESAGLLQKNFPACMKIYKSA